MTSDYRLKKEKDFDFVFKKGKRIYSSNLSLVYLTADCLKVGFAVSKKHGSSVQRNRIKRILRESFRSFQPKIRQNFFFVFIPKVSENLSLDLVKSEMEYILNKAKAFIEEENA